MLTRNDVGMVLGLCGFLLGGAGAYFGFFAQRTAQDVEGVLHSDGEMIEGLGAKLSELQADVRAANQRLSVLTTAVEELKKEDVRLGARVAELEAKLPK